MGSAGDACNDEEMLRRFDSNLWNGLRKRQKKETIELLLEDEETKIAGERSLFLSDP